MKVIAAAIDDTKEKVVYSAPPPKRHHHIIRAMADAGCPTPINDGSRRYRFGFLLEDNSFVNRKRAEHEARACGQLTKPIIGGVLTSEDLW